MKESRDLTGFIDGTENPPLSAAPEIALIPDGLPGAGGSVLLVQKWTHDAPAFEALSVEQQEKVIGSYYFVPSIEALRKFASADN